MADRPDRLMLLDTASLYFRAFFGIPDKIKAADGTSVNAVRGLLDFIARLVTTYEATHLVACWDDDWRPQWRVDLIPSYKSHRVVAAVASGVDIEETPDPLEAQVPVIRDVLDALDIAVVGAPGYEADDVIGTLVARSAMPVDVVTGDRDLFQLVSDERDVRIIYTARGMSNLEVVTDGSVVRKYGILPEQYADFAAMRGDPSDGLPGVKGVGDKTAAQLLQRYGDLDGIIAAAADPATTMASGLRGKILAADDYLKVAPTVVAVAQDLDLPPYDARIEPLIPESLALVAALQEKWNLGGSVDRVLPALRN
jgi:5'-3' exonuclease